MLDENAIVEKSKALIWSKYLSWNAGELAVFDTYLSRINARKRETAEVTFTKREYEELMGLKEVRPDQLNRYIKHFMGNVISIQTDRGWVNYPLFYKAKFEKNEVGEWEVTMRCHPELEDMFFNLADSGYQTYRLRYTLNLKSKYSKLLYCLLKDNLWRGTWEIDLKELRDLIGATEKTYNAFKDFNKFILKKAEEEINTETDIIFSYEKIMKGRLTKGIRFFIRESKQDEIPGQMSLFEDTKPLPEAAVSVTIKTKFHESVPEGINERELNTMELYAESCNFEFTWNEMQVIVNAIPSDVKFRTNKALIEDPQLSRADYLEEKYAILNTRDIKMSRFKYFVSLVKNDYE